MAKTKEELNQLKKEYEELTNKLNELSEDELNQIFSGVVMHNMPKINPDEKYVMKTSNKESDIDTRKDLYENIIL